MQTPTQVFLESEPNLLLNGDVDMTAIPCPSPSSLSLPIPPAFRHFNPPVKVTEEWDVPTSFSFSLPKTRKVKVLLHRRRTPSPRGKPGHQLVPAVVSPSQQNVSPRQQNVSPSQQTDASFNISMKMSEASVSAMVAAATWSAS